MEKRHGDRGSTHVSHSYQTYSVAASACQVVQACIWNSVAQLAKAWHGEQAVLEARGI